MSNKNKEERSFSDQIEKAYYSEVGGDQIIKNKEGKIWANNNNNRELLQLQITIFFDSIDSHFLSPSAFFSSSPALVVPIVVLGC
jgi:mannosyltransferase OCH1-like enzyme